MTTMTEQREIPQDGFVQAETPSFNFLRLPAAPSSLELDNVRGPSVGTLVDEEVSKLTAHEDEVSAAGCEAATADMALLELERAK